MGIWEHEIFVRIKQAGGRSYLVGGAVRDKLLGLSAKDWDIEVYGLNPIVLESILNEFGNVKAVGMTFGVFKLKTETTEYDFSLPRRENKIGQGHRGFQVELDPTLTPKEAAARRDFTINSIFQSIDTGQIMDFFNGKEDLQDKILRATSSHFGEDPLRVLRGFQFAARFNMTVERKTATMCYNLRKEYGTLALERIWAEWEKWALKGSLLSRGLKFLNDTAWVYMYPELATLMGLLQHWEWHPEGDVWKHTLQAVDCASALCDREKLEGGDRLVMVFASLCHDMGKVTTTEWKGRKLISHGHDKAGAEPTKAFLKRIGAPKWLSDRIVPIVTNHMVRRRSITTHKAVRRLAERLAPASLQELMWMVEIDGSSRSPAPPFVSWSILTILNLAEEAGCNKEPVKDILMGRHLIELGLEPGRHFGVILKKAREAQLDGVFSNLPEAMEWVREEVDSEG